MEKSYQKLIAGNKIYAETKLFQDPEYFAKLSKGQTPSYLWIGCSDSRVPANEITSTHSGEIFVHRNVANMVVNTDTNLLTVLEYAVHYLKVKHIIVCGHYNCGGVKAAMIPQDMGILNPWLRNIRDVYRLHKTELNAITDEPKRYDRLVELNVQEQCVNIIKTAALQLSYAETGYPEVHGWVFDMRTGRIIDLNIDFEHILKDIKDIYNLTNS